MSLAFWDCNFWYNSKSRVKIIKKNNKKVLTDQIYTAAMFCETIIESRILHTVQRQRDLKKMMVKY
ncbi:MAG: hypothetical protein ACFFD4_14270 [Candidatus Odinarchaeota archaeon]